MTTTSEMPAMRIGIVSHYWLPHRGGVEVMANEQARRLRDRGHDVRVVSSAIAAAPGTTDHPGTTGSLRIERHPASDVLGRRGVPWPVPSPRLVQAWTRLPAECDVLIVHGCTYAHSPMVIEAARRHDTPVLLLQANPHVDYPGVIDRVERLVDRTLGRWCCQRADRVASISAHTARHVARIAPKTSHNDIVYLGVDHERYRPPSYDERDVARARLSIGPADRVVLTVRRLVPRNGIAWAIRMWIDANLDRVGTFVIVGDGPQRAELETLARGHNIVFLGAVDDEHALDAFRAADVFVMPTRSGEGFGLAAAEAMSCGLPVVGTSGGALDEVIEHGVTGAVVAADDPRGFGHAVRRLLLDDEERGFRGRAARRRVEREFTWDRSVDRLEEILGSMTHASRRTNHEPVVAA
jgi:glycosyltransferase involved in cell wall biosynthesis